MAIEGGPTYRLSQQPWAQPGKICLRKKTLLAHSDSSKTFPLNAKGHVSAGAVVFLFFFFPPQYFFFFLSVFLAKINDLVTATYRVMKSKLPSILQSMSLYLANRDTEFILFKPVRVGRSTASLEHALQESVIIKAQRILPKWKRTCSA